MDVNSGAIHIVDEVVYDMLSLYQERSLEEIKTLLHDRYTEDEIGEAAGEIEELKVAGVLFTEDIYENYLTDFKKRPTVVKALCLHTVSYTHLDVYKRQRLKRPATGWCMTVI